MQKTINQHILESLLNAKKQLSNEAIGVIKDFVKSQKHENGGFIDRSSSADPYYTVFGLTLCFVFDIEIDCKKEKGFLKQWKENNEVDFVHAMSIIRCYYLLEAIKLKQQYNTLAKLAGKSVLIQNFVGYQIALKLRKKYKQLLLLITNYKTMQGGFNQLKQNSSHVSVYANFLAYGLFEDLQFNKEWKQSLIQSCLNMQLDNGSFVNHPQSKEGISSTTAAALLLLYQQKLPTLRTANWLKNVIDKSGGFMAGEQVPVADVLSTATALLALKISDYSTEFITQNAINFVNLHWHENGGFFGSIADQIPDVEYTFYGLLAVGC